MKVYTLRNFLVGLVLVTLLFASPKNALAFSDEIHYTFISPTAVTFDWRGDAATISYGITTSYGQTVTAGAPSPASPYSSEGPWKEAKLTGLTPDTVYHYSIAGSSDSTFKTPPVPGASGFTVYAEGDIGSSLSFRQVSTMQQLISQGSPAFVLAPGDLTYGNSTTQADVDQHFNDVMAWSKSAAYMPAWGNHEWDKTSDDLRNYKGRFDLPNSQADPKSPSISCCGEDWYWFDYGNVRFIAYPEPWSGDNWSHWNTVVKPIMDDAQANPNITFIVTFGHRAAWSTGYHAGESILANYIKGLRAGHSKYVLNINGHSHNYERTDPTLTDGVMNITTGTGGGYLENVNSSGCLWQSCPPPAWSAQRFMRYGVTKLVFTSTGIQGSFICGPTGGGTNDVTCNVGDTIDTFTIGTPSNTTPTLMQPSPTMTQVPSNTCQNVPINTGTIQVGVNIQTAGVYKTWARMMAPTSTQNTYYMQVDTNCFLMGGGSISPNTWTWIDYQDADVTKKVLLTLSSGLHTVKFIGSGAAVKLDDFIVTPDTNCIPTGTGQNCAGGTITPTATPTLVPTVTLAPSPTLTPTHTPTPTITPPPASTLTLYPSDDVSVKKSSPTSNYRGATNLYADGNPIFQFLIKFPVSGTGGKRIKNATMRLYVKDSSAKGGDVSLISNTWSESTVTWNTAPVPTSVPVVNIGAVKSRKWVDVDLTKAITAENIYSFRISTTASDGVTYASTEYLKGYEPRLILTFE